MNAESKIEHMIDVTSAMVSLNIGKIERYPGGHFTVALMDGSLGQGRSVGEAFDNIQHKRRAA
jgi:hypothetical protein